MTNTDILRRAGELLTKMRQDVPLVHCMTNHVVTNFTANVLLAAGAAPAMIHDPEEAGLFAGIASALLVNVGTLEREQAEGMRRAVASAVKAGRPWVLDPVAVGGLPFRTVFAKELLRSKPTMVRGNASEILALGGGLVTGRGVDSTQGVAAAAEAARAIAEQTGGAVLVTGEVDLIVAAGCKEAIRCSNGTALLTRVTGVGCAQGALCAALCASCDGDWMTAAVTAALLVCLAGEIAEGVSSRPGSFQIAYLDALDEVDAAVLMRNGKVSVEA
ncbi:MAG: hydroxyethylthiazole kinase [Kiritimatiellia bacterium]